MVAPSKKHALALFAPLAPDYERWASVLSLGQDPRWRGEMVARLDLDAGARVLDVAAGTGAITRLLEARSCDVTALDQSAAMLTRARERGATVALATAEQLPFPDAAFDGLTFSYLLRYVADPADCMRELVRVLRPEGVMGMVEFGRPRGFWGPCWKLYTGLALPVAGAGIGSGWRRVGRFLGPSIEAFHRRFPDDRLRALWRDAGLVEVRIERRSLGGGLLMWGRRR